MRNDGVQVTVAVTRNTVSSLLWGMSRWPDEDADNIANRFISWGWQIVSYLHEGSAVRICTPRQGPLEWLGFGAWRGPNVMPLELTDDPYACPDRYVEKLVRSDTLDQAILSFSTGKAVGNESKSVRSLVCQFDLKASNVRAIEAYAIFYSKTEALNRLIQLGFARGMVESRRGRLEYRLNETELWKILPSV